MTFLQFLKLESMPSPLQRIDKSTEELIKYRLILESLLEERGIESKCKPSKPKTRKPKK